MKTRAIPKERYLGVYFKSGDQDLIDWKRDADNENLTEFAKTAIREKLERERREQKLEHPSVILKRMESQQVSLFAMIQQILRAIQKGGMIGGDVAQADEDESNISVGIIVENTLDRRCAEAGWE